MLGETRKERGKNSGPTVTIFGHGRNEKEANKNYYIFCLLLLHHAFITHTRQTTVTKVGVLGNIAATTDLKFGDGTVSFTEPEPCCILLVQFITKALVEVFEWQLASARPLTW